LGLFHHILGVVLIHRQVDTLPLAFLWAVAGEVSLPTAVEAFAVLGALLSLAVHADDVVLHALPSKAIVVVAAVPLVSTTVIVVAAHLGTVNVYGDTALVVVVAGGIGRVVLGSELSPVLVVLPAVLLIAPHVVVKPLV
jgi:uncharacterized membrane protein